MKSKCRNKARLSGLPERGVTLVEVLFASSISLMICLALAYLMLAVAREQRVGRTEHLVNQYADHVQDRISYRLRNASRRHGTHLSDPTDSTNTFYYTLDFEKAMLSDPPEPMERFRYDPDTKALTYDPDTSVSGNEKTIAPKGVATTLDNVRFHWATTPEGIPDSSTIIVLVDISDHGYARRPFRDGADPTNWISVSRTFTINLRRE